MKKRVGMMCLLVFFCSGSLPAQTDNPEKKPNHSKSSKRNEKIIKDARAVLDAQVAAWNRGDLEGFMQGYWHSPELTFNSGAKQTGGWDETLARYKKRYQSDGREMGTLRFDGLDILPLGKDAALVRGQWKLQLKDSAPGGLFTLILRRFPEGWRIIHDHTS